jgi:hypothetical protein
MTAPKRGRVTPPKPKETKVPLPAGLEDPEPEPEPDPGDAAQDASVEAEIALVPQQVAGIRVPMPAIPLPLNFFFGLVPLGQTPVILVTALNDSGSMIQGYFSPEIATKIGRDLLKAARDAEIEASHNRLVVPGKGLLVPA